MLYFGARCSKNTHRNFWKLLKNLKLMTMQKIPGVISGDFYYLYHDENPIRKLANLSE
jgi:hypothetical protein